MNETAQPPTTAYGLTSSLRITPVLVYNTSLFRAQPVRLFGFQHYSYLKSFSTCETTRIREGTRAGKALNTIATEIIIDVFITLIFPLQYRENRK